MDIASLISKLVNIESMSKGVNEAKTQADYARAQQQMDRLEKAAQYTGDDEIVRGRMGLPPKLPPFDQWDGNMPKPTGKPDWVARLSSMGQATTDQATAVATNKADDTSVAFKQEKLTQLKALVAKIQGGGSGGPAQGQAAQPATTSAPKTGPVSVGGVTSTANIKPKPAVQTQSIDRSSSIAKSLVESFNYELSEDDIEEKVTLGTGPAVTNPATGVTSGKFQQEVADIKKIIGELSDMADNDPEIAKAIQDAQAAIDNLAKQPETPPAAALAAAEPAAAGNTPAQGQAAQPAQSTGTVDPKKLARFKELLAKAGQKAAPAQGQAAQPATPNANTTVTGAPLNPRDRR